MRPTTRSTSLRRLILIATLFAVGGTARAGELTIYAIKSKHGVSWKSPRALAMSTLVNNLNFDKYKRAIGHVAVRLTGKGKEILTGMSETDAGKRQYTKLAMGGRGLGIILDTVEGRLEDGKDLAPELAQHEGKGRLNYIKFKINDETEARLREYLAEYERRGIEHRYGGPNRPRLGEGAGCSAFGASCMTVAGVMTHDMAKSWNQKVLIPSSLIGGDGAPKVALTKLVFGKPASRFAKPDEPHMHLDIFDPELINHWIEDKWHEVNAGYLTDGNIKIEKTGQAFGLVIDATATHAKGPLFYK